MFNKKSITRVALILLSSVVQAWCIGTFVQTAGMLPCGFTGLATILSQVANNLGFEISVSIFMVALNLPAALLCARAISPKFVALSFLQVFTTSFLLATLKVTPIFDDVLLNVTIGGVIYGFSIVMALKANASSGGTDFIAMYVSNKTGITIYNYLFAFNAILLVTFGFMNDFYYAGYSILMNYIITKTINVAYDHYKQVTLQITTTHAQEIVSEYTSQFRHGISIVDAVGGYSKREVNILYTVVSTEEAEKVAKLIRKIDEKVIINAFKTEKFYGGFYRRPIG